MQTNYSIKQPSKCDHATQMQLESDLKNLLFRI